MPEYNPDTIVPVLIDRKQAARMLGISLTQIERFRRRGRLPYVMLTRGCIRYFSRLEDCKSKLISRS